MTNLLSSDCCIVFPGDCSMKTYLKWFLLNESLYEYHFDWTVSVKMQRSSPLSVVAESSILLPVDLPNEALESSCAQIDSNLSFSINRLLQGNGIESSTQRSQLAFANSPFLFGKLLSNISNFSKSFDAMHETTNQVETPLMSAPFSWINTHLIKPGVSSKLI